MTDEQTPSIEDLKAGEKVERLVIEEEDLDTKSGAGYDVAAEFQKLGHQLGETLQSAWESEERKRIEQEVREGVRSFVAEIDKVLHEVKASETTNKLNTSKYCWFRHRTCVRCKCTADKRRLLNQRV